MHQLDEISTVIRAPGVPLFSPMEIAWQVTTAAGAGALTAWMASRQRLLGAAVPAAGRAVAALGSLGYRLFGPADSASRGRSGARYETTSLRSISLAPFSPIGRSATLISDVGPPRIGRCTVGPFGAALGEDAFCHKV